MKKVLLAMTLFVLALVPAFAQTNYGKFTVTTPMALTTSGPAQGTTHDGVSYTSATYSADLANSDAYLVMVSTYPFTVQNDNLAQCLNAFVSSSHGTVLSQKDFTLASGEPAIAAEIDVPGARDLLFAYVVSYKGNSAYQFAFGSYQDVTTTDMKAVKTFLNTLRIN